MLNYRLPSYWITFGALGLLAADRFDLNTLELIGAFVVFGFALAFLDEVVMDLLPRLFRPGRRQGKQSRGKAS